MGICSAWQCALSVIDPCFLVPWSNWHIRLCNWFWQSLKGKVITLTRTYAYNWETNPGKLWRIQVLLDVWNKSSKLQDMYRARTRFIRRVERKMQLAVVEQRRQRGGKALVTVGQTVIYVVWLAPGTGVSDFILLEEGDWALMAQCGCLWAGTSLIPALMLLLF